MTNTATTTENHEPQAFLVWDTYEITQAQANFLQEENEELDDDTAFSQACEDYDLLTHEWDYLTEALTEKLQEINPNGRWRCDASGLGWQRRSGYKHFEADDGQAFLRAILPDTECTFQIYLEGEGDEQTIRIVNSHHDAMGEVYEIRKDTEDED